MSDDIGKILRSCGYPESVLTLDAECYFDKDFSLSKMSTYEYVADPRFAVLGWASKFNDRPAEFGELPMQGVWPDTTIVLFNAPFDALVLTKHYGVRPAYIIDVLDLARHIEPRWRNTLAALCERHNLPAKGDTKLFAGMHHYDFSPTEWRGLVEYATNDANRTYDLLGLLLPKLSNPKFELDLARFTRDMFLAPVLHFDMDRAETLKTDMLAEIGNAIKRTGDTEKAIRGKKSFETLIREALGAESPPMKPGKLGSLLAIAKTDEGYKYLLHHDNSRVRALMEARIAAYAWPKRVKRVQRIRTMFQCAGDLLPVPLNYAGCHTGRWSGRDKTNFQNFTARGHELANRVRTLIEAPAGHLLIISDFCQIEARVLNWLADQHDIVQAFADGRPVYCEFASRLTGHQIRKPRKTDTETVAKWFGDYRQMGKIGELGSGFGMGPDRCVKQARDTYGIILEPAMGKRIIDLYRRTHAQVVLFWKKVEQAFRLATQYPNRVHALEHDLLFSREDSTTVIQLPSTRQLRYAGARVTGTARYPQLEMPNPKATKQWAGNALSLWDGLLVENIVQAVARDILAETILKVEKLGLRVAMTVHDDFSVVVREDEAEAYKIQIEKIARTPPTWATGLPVDVESKISKQYVK